MRGGAVQGWLRYGVISRHFGKDGSHELTEEEWDQLPGALQSPFAITRIKGESGSFRIYTTLKNAKGEYVVVGIDVKNAGRGLEVNAISTVFGRREGASMTEKEEEVYRSEKITPEQSSLLDRPNPGQYPTEGELLVGKGSEKAGKPKGKPAEPKAKPEEPKNSGQFGLVSDERMEELKARLRKKLGQLNSGLDPEMLAIGMELAAGHLDRGIKKFADFARVMIADLGDCLLYTSDAADD